MAQIAKDIGDKADSAKLAKIAAAYENSSVRRYALTDASDTGDLPNVPSRAEELMKILHVVEHSSIARSSKQFLAHCLSAVVSLESSRSRKDQAFEFRPQKARAAVKRTPKQPSRVSDHPRSSN